jgi:glycosyltransferase involved in cell wall biosynthesis
MEQEIKEKHKSERPLVSVNVVTYNSAETIVETLESIKGQTYPRIELIVSDDCSKDNTVVICREWIASNKARFENTQIITTPVNTGISKNCNRALFAATGEWIKPIAGDDTLKPDCVQDNLNFIHQIPDARIVFSRVDKFKNTFKEENKIEPDPKYAADSKMFSELDTEYQLKVLSRVVIIRAPSLFFSRYTVTDIGGFDESSRFMEDWPSYFRWLNGGLKFHYLDKSTINYRISSSSVSNSKESSKMQFSQFPIRVEETIRKLFYPNYTLYEKLLFDLEYGYYRYYLERESKSVISRIIQRIWYHFVKKSLSTRKNSLERFHRKFIKSTNNRAR